MKKILLIGNPNVGKSAIFSRLTGVYVIASNYPGTSVEYKKGYLTYNDEKYEIIDVPGIYSLDASCKAEEITLKMIKEGEIFINVIDSTNLERNLNLTLQLIEMKKPMIIALNFWDDTEHRGIAIDKDELEKILGIPVTTTCGASGEGINNLVFKIINLDEHKRTISFKYDLFDRWKTIGMIIGKVQKLSHRHHSFFDLLKDASIKPYFGLPFAVIVLFLVFFIIRFAGEGLIKYVFDPFFSYLWLPLMNKLSLFLSQKGFFHTILIGNLINGTIDYSQSFGILTTGLYVILAVILPYVFSFYIVLSFLEDSGYLPRLSVLLDRVMHLLGLHGVSVIPMLLGLGCNVPGIIATRIMETKKEKFILVVLIAISIPCAAKTAMIIGLVGKYGLLALLAVFGTLFFIWFTLGIILRRLVKGESPEIFLEIPPYRLPYLNSLIKKVRMRTVSFLKEAVPFVLLGILITNILYSLSIISFLSQVTGPMFKLFFDLPSEAVASLIIGFLRKDIAVGMLAPLHLNLKQIIIATVMLSTYFPCIGTFTIIIKELGIKNLLIILAIMLSTTLIIGTVLNLILSLFL
jgi:ferrous iron transport protein B